MLNLNLLTSSIFLVVVPSNLLVQVLMHPKHVKERQCNCMKSLKLKGSLCFEFKFLSSLPDILFIIIIFNPGGIESKLAFFKYFSFMIFSLCSKHIVVKFSFPNTYLCSGRILLKKRRMMRY